jgi:hypothetical protein
MAPSRRKFLASSTVAVAGLSISEHLLGAPFTARRSNLNETIRMGFIGVGNRGSKLLGWFQENSDVEIAALCDVL